MRLRDVPGHAPILALVGAACMALAFAAVGCSAASHDGRVALPRFDSEGGGMSASIDGTLRAGTVAKGAECVWLERPNGESSAIAWGFPAFLDREEQTVVDAEGAVLARIGDEVLLVGGYDDSVPVGDCRVGELVIAASEISVVREK